MSRPAGLGERPNAVSTITAAKSRSRRASLLSVFIVPAHPGHAPRQAAFVAAFRRHVEEIIGADKNIEAARVGCIRVQDFASFILDGGAHTRFSVSRKLRSSVIVLALASRRFRTGRREMDLVSEVVSPPARPFSLPPHSYLVPV